MKRKRLSIMVLIGLLMLSGCQKQETVQEPPVDSESEQASITMTLDEYPKIDGSTVTIPLSEAIAASVLHMAPDEAREYVLHNTTHLAYINLIEHKADLILVTSPSEEEMTYAAEMKEKLVVTPIVSEGFVFLVNKDNPVDSLTLAQIQDIYRGKITNWQEVGGNDEPIIAFQRPINSGSQTGMFDLVLSETEIMAPPTEVVIAEMGELIDAVANYDNSANAIGYSYYYYATDMWLNDDVKLLAVDGVFPNTETIKSGEYPIRTAYYAVTLESLAKDSKANELLAWILSDEGQRVAQASGYVPIGN